MVFSLWTLLSCPNEVPRASVKYAKETKPPNV